MALAIPFLLKFSRTSLAAMHYLGLMRFHMSFKRSCQTESTSTLFTYVNLWTHFFDSSVGVTCADISIVVASKAVLKHSAVRFGSEEAHIARIFLRPQVCLQVPYQVWMPTDYDSAQNAFITCFFTSTRRELVCCFFGIIPWFWGIAHCFHGHWNNERWALGNDARTLNVWEKSFVRLYDGT